MSKLIIIRNAGDVKETGLSLSKKGVGVFEHWPIGTKVKLRENDEQSAIGVISGYVATRVTIFVPKAHHEIGVPKVVVNWNGHIVETENVRGELVEQEQMYEVSSFMPSIVSGIVKAE
jgi:hypothetical protein